MKFNKLSKIVTTMFVVGCSSNLHAGSIEINTANLKPAFEGIGAGLDDNLANWQDLSTANEEELKTLLNGINFNTVKYEIKGSANPDPAMFFERESIKEFVTAVHKLKQFRPNLKVQLTLHDLPDELEKTSVIEIDSSTQEIVKHGEFKEDTDTLRSIARYYYDVLAGFKSEGIVIDELNLSEASSLGAAKLALLFIEPVDELKRLIREDNDYDINMPKIIGPSLEEATRTDGVLNNWKNNPPRDVAFNNLDVISTLGDKNAWSQSHFDEVYSVSDYLGPSGETLLKPFIVNSYGRIQSGDPLFNTFNSEDEIVPANISNLSLALRLTSAINAGAKRFIVEQLSNEELSPTAILQTSKESFQQSVIYPAIKHIAGSQPSGSQIAQTSVESDADTDVIEVNVGTVEEPIFIEVNLLDNLHIVTFKSAASNKVFVHITNLNAQRVQDISLKVTEVGATVGFSGIKSIVGWKSDAESKDLEFIDKKYTVAQQKISVSVDPYSVTTYEIEYDPKILFARERLENIALGIADSVDDLEVQTSTVHQNKKTNSGFNAFDGDRSPFGDRWVSKTYSVPQWISIDLGTPRKISAIAMYSGYEVYTAPVTDFEVQKWVGPADGDPRDAENWQTFHKIEGNDNPAKVFYIDNPVVTDKVRMFATAVNGNAIKLYELEIYSPLPTVSNIKTSDREDVLIEWDSFGNGYTYNIYASAGDGGFNLIRSNLSGTRYIPVEGELASGGTFTLAVVAVDNQNQEVSGFSKIEGVLSGGVDLLPPVVVPPNDIIYDTKTDITEADLLENGGTFSIGEAEAYDSVDGEISVVNNLAEILPLKVGDIQVVTWTAIDSAGNITTAYQNILIQDPDSPLYENIPPEIEPTDRVDLYATGRLTVIGQNDLILPNATDDSGEPSVELEGQYVLASGKHKVNWFAEDIFSNTAIYAQDVYIHPIASLRHNLASVLGNELVIPVYLSGNAAVYPVSLKLSVNHAESGLQRTEIVTIESGQEGSYQLTLPNDGSLMKGDEIVISIEELRTEDQILIGNATVGETNTIKVKIVDPSVTHFPHAKIKAFQNGIAGRVFSTKEGLLTLKPELSDIDFGDNHTVEWLVTDTQGVEVDESGDVNDQNFEFNLSNQSTGTIRAEFSIKENGVLLESAGSVEYFQVVESFPDLKTISDIDGDGIADAYEGYIDEDGDGITDWRDNNKKLAELPIGFGIESIKTETGYVMAVGDTVIAIDKRSADGADISNDSLIAAGIANEGINLNDIEFNSVSKIVDFKVMGLAVPGQTAQVILPLARGDSLPENAKIRVFNRATGWADFVVNDMNNVKSISTDEFGNCPKLSLDTNFQTGLIPGYSCIRLQIKDGGANDLDQKVNGQIAFLGFSGVANSAPEATVEVISQNRGSVDANNKYKFDTFVVNDPLVISNGTATVVQEQQYITLSAEKTVDADALFGEALSYHWEQDPNDEIQVELGTLLVNETNATINLTGLKTSKQTGIQTSFFYEDDISESLELNFNLTVSDGKKIDTHPFSLILMPNQSPQLNPLENLNVKGGEEVSLSAIANDPDGDNLYYRWEILEGKPVRIVNDDQGTMTFISPSYRVDSEIRFKVSVFDGVETVSDEVTVSTKSTDSKLASSGALSIWPILFLSFIFVRRVFKK